MKELEKDLQQIRITVASELSESSTRLEVSQDRIMELSDENRMLQRAINSLSFPIEEIMAECRLAGMYPDITTADSSVLMDKVSSSKF